jgi:hypothetical protein
MHKSTKLKYSYHIMENLMDITPAKDGIDETCENVQKGT